MSLTHTTINILCAATDVGMQGLLASQSCYHSVLPPVEFLGYWNKGAKVGARGTRPKILLINIHYSLKSIA